MQEEDDDDDEEEEEGEEEGEAGEAEPKYKSLNKVLRNKGDPEAVRQARAAAKQGGASAAVVRWLFPPKELRRKVARREKYAEFSDATPPVVLTRQVIDAAIAHLSRVDPKLEALIARIGAASLEMNIGTPKPPTQAAYLPISPYISLYLPISRDEHRHAQAAHAGAPFRQVPQVDHLHDGQRRGRQRVPPPPRHEGVVYLLEYGVL